MNKDLDIRVQYYKMAEIRKIAVQVADFYRQNNFTDEFGNIEQMILNSQGLAVAYSSDKIVAAGRIVGDAIRFAYIVDLVVNDSHQKRGIGTRVVQILAKNAKTFWIELTTDPNDPGLVDFYKKAGFELSKGEHVFEWPKTD